MRRKIVWVLCGVLLSASGLAVWTLRSAPRPIPPPCARPNLLLITLDTTRADHLPMYGYVRDTTPNLRRLAQRSRLFSAAWAPMATTLPSHTSLMTGAWPLEHGVLGNAEHGGRIALPTDALQPIAGLLRDAGYQTAAFVSATPVREGTGIERGFEVFDDPERNVRHAKQTTTAAARWLREHGGEPFFLWVHYFDAHGPFEPQQDADLYEADAALRSWMADRAIPEVAFRTGGAELDPLAAHDGYDAEIRYVDDHMQRLIDILDDEGWWEETIIVVVGDHGEGLGQHDIGGHGHVWREQLQVPLVVYVPWRAGGERIDTPISMVDVMPTLLSEFPSLDSSAWREKVSGRDIFRDGPAPSLALSSIRQDTVGIAHQRALTAGHWRLVEVQDTTHLFDLDSDPHEQTDLSPLLPAHTAILSALTSRLHDEQQARGQSLGTGGTAPLSDEALRGLAELGYIDE